MPIYENPTAVACPAESDFAFENESIPEYDVVIIGGGTAGCVLASRLSEDPRVRVLLLEAGGSSRNVKESYIPAAYGGIFNTDKVYKFWTEEQTSADGLKKYWPKGRMLGGCSSVNALVFHAGAPTDYDEWGQTGLEGAEQWSHQNFLPYFQKYESFVPSFKYPPEVDRSTGGSEGPVKVGHFGYISKAALEWAYACENIGIRFNPDVNHPVRGTLGVTKVPALKYIDASGKRVSTESAYLTPKVLKRPNLKVSIYSQVTRILFRVEREIKTAVGVEFAREKEGPRYHVRAKQQIVLAAGAIHSPHILMLSGVGPKEHLLEHGITPICDIPGVGQNLQDHVNVVTRFRVKKGQSLQFLSDPWGINFFRTLAALVQWKLFGTGPLTTNLAEAIAFVRSDNTNLIPAGEPEVKDETSGPNAPDLETLINPMGYPIPDRPIPPGELVTLATILLRPQSVGSIKLQSKDAFDTPLADPRYLSSTNDVHVLVRGLKLTLRIARTEPLASIIEHDDDPLLDHNLHRLSNAELESEVRKRPETAHHATSTCRMARLEDGGVVDAYLSVHGIQHLRIADASIFPRLIAGHTAAATIAVGEKASDIIKQSLQLK